MSSAVGRLTLGGGRFAAAVDFAVAFAFSIVAAVVLRVVFDRLAPLFSSRRDEGYFVLDRVFPILSFVAIRGCWFFFYLLYYPGCTSGDSNDILKMVLGLPFEADHFRYDTWNNHHPIAYTALVSLFVNAGA